jgi:histone H3/H4
VKKKSFPIAETERLFNDLKKKRKDILRFSKQATVYVNMLCEKIIEDLITSCQPIHQGKKSQEKTLGWK